MLYHPANGGLRSKAEAGRFKAGGVIPGVSDLHLPANSVIGEPGLWIELKAPAGTVSVAQSDWLQRMVYRGEHAAIVRTTGAAIMLLAWHLGDPELLMDANKHVDQLTLGHTRLGVFSYQFHSYQQEIKAALQMTPEHGLDFSRWVMTYRNGLIA